MNQQALLHCPVHPMAPSHCLIQLECYAGPCHEPAEYSSLDRKTDRNGHRLGVSPSGLDYGMSQGRKRSFSARVGLFWRYKLGGWRGTSVILVLAAAGGLVMYSWRELQRARQREFPGYFEASLPRVGSYLRVQSPGSQVFRTSTCEELPFDTV